MSISFLPSFRATLFCAISFVSTLSLLAEDTPPSPAPAFAVIPPAVATGLAAKKDSPAGAALIRDADKHLADVPDPLPRLHAEGTLPHQGIYDESVKAGNDFDIMYKLALAYRLTGDDRYLKGADAYLVAWATVYKIGLNPIDETRMDNILLAYDLVKDAVPAATREKMTAFLRSMAEGYAVEVVKKKGDSANWQSHRIKLFALSAFALGDEALIKQAHEAFSQHLGVNIRADSSVDDFYKRDALHYVTYDLEPLAMTCLAAKEHGQDWFNEGDPRSVAKAIDWLLPFATGQQSHIEFVHSTVKFDQDRAKAGLGEYGPHPWEPKHSITLLSTAAALDPARTGVCRQVATTAGSRPNDGLVVLFWPDK